MPRKPPAHVTTIVGEPAVPPAPITYFVRCTCGWISPYTRRFLARFAADEHLKATDPGTGWVEPEALGSEVAQEVTPS